MSWIRGLWRRLLLLAAALALPLGQAKAAPLHYTVDATFRPAAGTVAVSLEISLPPVRAGETVNFALGSTYRVARADAGRGARVEVAPSNRPWNGVQGIAATFAQATARPKLRLVYEGRLSPTGDPPINLITPELVEVSLDGMWLPIQADLSGRFTVDAVLRGLPARAQVVAQGVVRRRGNMVFVRRTFGEVDFAFVASSALRRVQEANFTFYAADPGSELSRLYRRHGDLSLTYLKQLLGPLRSGTPALVVVRRPRRSGYARKGYVVVTDQGNAQNPRGTAGFIAHEFSHLWFSNANAATDNRWLDESFAEYIGLRYVEHAFGAEARSRTVERLRRAAASAPPILGSGRGDGSTIYTKGPVLLFELEQQIGRERMDVLIRKVASGQITTTEQFLTALSTTTTPDEARQFESRLRS